MGFRHSLACAAGHGRECADIVHTDQIRPSSSSSSSSRQRCRVVRCSGARGLLLYTVVYYHLLYVHLYHILSHTQPASGSGRRRQPV